MLRYKNVQVGYNQRIIVTVLSRKDRSKELTKESSSPNCFDDAAKAVLYAKSWESTESHDRSGKQWKDNRTFLLGLEPVPCCKSIRSHATPMLRSRRGLRCFILVVGVVKGES